MGAASEASLAQPDFVRRSNSSSRRSRTILLTRALEVLADRKKQRVTPGMRMARGSPRPQLYREPHPLARRKNQHQVAVVPSYIDNVPVSE
jgi:hypothetical protein